MAATHGRLTHTALSASGNEHPGAPSSTNPRRITF
jgi:hypothetical protein